MQPDPSGFWEVLQDKGFLAFIGAVGGAIAGVFTAGRRMGKFEMKQDQFETTLTEITTTLAAMNNDFRQRLYRPDGRLIYVTQDTFEKIQGQCRTEMRDDLRDIKNKLDELVKMHMRDNAQ